MENVFSCLTPVTSELLTGRQLTDDPRLGEQVLTGADRISEATRVVILGCPQDEGVSRNAGRPGAGRAPEVIRRCLYRMTTRGVRVPGVVDIGDVDVAGSLEETHDRLSAVIEHVMNRDLTAVVLGGGNDLSRADVRGLQRARGRTWAVNLDAHFDVRPGDLQTSGTPYRWLIENGVLAGEDFCEIGWQPQAVSAEHERWLRSVGARLHDLEEVRRRGLVSLLEDCRDLAAGSAGFVGFDMDCVRASDAPGVSAPSPIGLMAEEAVLVGQWAGARHDVDLLEITEVSPDHDVDDRTARLAALIVHAFLRMRLPV